MRLLSILFLVVVSGCQCGIDSLTRADRRCGQFCYDLDAGIVGIGQCQYGTWICKEDSMVCDGEVGPSQEICDGIDNNCNNQIDEQLVGCCANPTPEVCDGIDNDCNGIIDDNVPATICYNAPNSTLSNPPCRPGVLRCTLGMKICDGAVTPQPEICDGIDNNCNGQIDEGLTSSMSMDLLFVIDNSGSMFNQVQHIQNAVTAFSTKYANNTELRWGIVGAPGPDIANTKPVLITQLGNIQAFQAGIGLMSDTGTGDEPTLDALWEICSYDNPLQIRWMVPGNFRRIILFSDEQPQSHFVPFPSYVQVAIQCELAGIPVYTFVYQPYSILNVGYRKITEATNGKMFEISSPTMENDLETLITSITCR